MTATGMRIGSLFSGYGGADLAVQAVWPDATPAWFVEHDKHPSAVLAQRFPGVPNYGDITAVDWTTVEPVDILTGGFPCQDLSHAGKRAGLRPGTRSGLWDHMAYCINQLQPRLVVIENVRGLLSAGAASDLERDCWCVGDRREPDLRALGAVLGDLADIGYDARWTGVRASDAGAPHGRFRVFIVAHPQGDGRGQGRTESGERSRGAGLPAGSGAAARDADGVGREWAGANGVEGRGGRSEDTLQDVAYMGLLGTPTAHPDNIRSPEQIRTGLTPSEVIAAGGDFGPYTQAIRRWEPVIGRPAPSPTTPGKNDRPRLNPIFVEWMMGLPEGWVTDTGIPRNAQLKALGNGIVPQQMALALRLLMDMP